MAEEEQSRRAVSPALSSALQSSSSESDEDTDASKRGFSPRNSYRREGRSVEYAAQPPISVLESRAALRTVAFRTMSLDRAAMALPVVVVRKKAVRPAVSRVHSSCLPFGSKPRPSDSYPGNSCVRDRRAHAASAVCETIHNNYCEQLSPPTL